VLLIKTNLFVISLKLLHPNSHIKKNRRGKSVEIINDEDWNAIRNFQTTKIEEKTGLDADIDLIRVNLNKITDKNYIDIIDKISKIFDKINENINENRDENMFRLSSIIFEIASTNRYFSKVYADLYSELSVKFDIIKTLSEKKLEDFTGLFNTIEYVDPNFDLEDKRIITFDKMNKK
jgi:hypothetical protein